MADNDPILPPKPQHYTGDVNIADFLLWPAALHRGAYAKALRARFRRIRRLLAAILCQDFL
jgi:hypothetical protein